MARLRLPLYGKILLWFLVNLLVLALLGLGFMRAQFNVGLDWMLAGPGGERLEQLGKSLTAELRNLSEPEWVEALARHEAALGLTVALFGSDGLQKLGPPLVVPPDVRPMLSDKRSAADMPPPPRPGRMRNTKAAGNTAEAALHAAHGESHDLLGRHSSHARVWRRPSTSPTHTRDRLGLRHGSRVFF